MEIEEYQNIFEQEEIHWWYLSLRDAVLNTLEKLPQSDGSLPILLDAGCGTGGVLKAVSEKFPGWDLAGVDMSYHALTYCRKKRLHNLLQASVEHLPFADESLNIIISLDVLYHLQVGDDEKSLAEIYRVLKKRGHVILHLPAFEFLRGAHDRVVHTRERYRRNQLCNKMEKAGFQVTMCTYRHMILFPVLFFKRIFERYRADNTSKSDLETLPLWLNSFLNFVSQYENRLIRYFNLPMGSSLFCLGKKV